LITDGEALTKYCEPVPLTTNRFSKATLSRWCKRFGWSRRAWNTPGKYLVYHDPKMEAYRTKFKEVLLTTQSHPRLVLNFDQLWKQRHRGSKATYWKDPAQSGKRSFKGKRSVSKLLDRLSADSVGPAVHPPADTTAPPDKRRRVAQLGQDVRNYTVVDARMPHTVTTSVWSDGTPGPLYVVFAGNTVSQTMLDKVNTKYVGRLFATTSNKASHMMDADLTVSMLEDLITPVFLASLEQSPKVFDTYVPSSAILCIPNSFRVHTSKHIPLECTDGIAPMPRRNGLISSLVQP